MRRVVVGFWLGIAVPLALLSLYTYHITCSLEWSRMMTIVPDLPLFSTQSVGRRLVGPLFDTDRA